MTPGRVPGFGGRIAMKIAVLFALAVLACVSRPSLAAEEPSDEQRIRGGWTLVSTIKGTVETKTPEAADESDNAPLTVTFDESTWTAKIGSKGAPTKLGGSYYLDSKQTPKLLDVTIRGDGGNSSNLYFIYRFEKDRLHLRLQTGGQRPVDFESACEDCTTLIFRHDKD